MEKLFGKKVKGLVVVAGRPGVGVTGFMLDKMIVLSEEGKKCVYFTMGESKEIAVKLQATVSKVPCKQIAKGTFNQEQSEAVEKAKGKLAELNITLCDAMLSASNIEDMLNEVCAKQNPDYLFVENVNRVECRDEKPCGDLRKKTTSAKVVAVLKKVAKNFAVNVVAGATLKRNVAFRGTRLADVGYCKLGKEDAVVLIDRGASEDGKTVVKSFCNGRRKVIECKFDSTTLTFRQLAEG